MRVLVTGASGFLGGWIAEQLLAAGHEVRALVRPSSNTKHLAALKSVELVQGGMDDEKSIYAAVLGVEAVIHSAGLVKARNQAEFERTNVAGTRLMIEATRAHGVKRFVLVSSLEATGPSPDGEPVPVTQERPVTAYGRSKLLGEKEVLKHRDDVHITILRPGAIYGPRDVEIFEAFKSVSRGLKPTFAKGHARGSFIYAQDCAELCVRALSSPAPSGSIFHAVDNTPLTQLEFFDRVEKALGKKALLNVSLPKFLLKGVSYGVQAFGQLSNRAVMLTPEKAEMLLMHWVADSREAQVALQWQPLVSMERGCAQSVQWYREQGWL
jgi:2-alkyl-3-oxoalkanoate reductase